MSAITISNLRISPYTQKDTISKIVYGDEWSITVALPTPHATGDKYAIGIDYENTLYPPNRPLCAGTEAFVLQDNNLTFSVKLSTARLRDWLSSIKKPTPITIQIVRVRNNRAETLLLDTILALPSVFDGVVTVCEGDAIQVLLDAKLDKPAIDGTEGQILSINADGQLVWRDEQEIPEQVQADYDESDSGAVSYIRNKPDLSIYVEKEAGKGLSTNDFTDADVTKLEGIENGAEVNVQADYDESDSTADSYIRHKPVISTVGHTGSYSDLLNKPDLSVYSLITETGNKLSMSIDSDYVLTVGLLDKNNNELDSKNIDLPLEAMIVNASYANGVLTLTLQNGQTLTVDISDIVSGLVPDSRTINGHELSSNVTITASDLNLATVATSGSYNDLIDKPVVEQADWSESDSSEASYIRNKPVILEQEQADWDESDSTDVSYIQNKPEIPEDGLDYLCFTAGQENSTVKIYGNPVMPNSGVSYIEYSFDKVNWEPYTWTTPSQFDGGIVLTLSNFGDSVWFRGSAKRYKPNYGEGYHFVMTGKIYASGSIMSLLDPTCKQVDLLPDNSKAFQGLFYNCSALITPPKLPSKTIVSNCYDGMFASCTGLTEVPELPPIGGYYQMFYNCTSLVDASKLTLDGTLTTYFPNSGSSMSGRFEEMFQGCTSLAYAPTILSVGLISTNYARFRNMFNGCSSLKHIKINATEWGNGNNWTSWLSGVSPTGIFECPSALDCSTRDGSHVPAGWTIVRTDAPWSDWTQTDSTEASYIKNKPVIPSPQVQADWDESDSSDVSYIQNKPTVEPQVQANFLTTDTTSPSYISNRGWSGVENVSATEPITIQFGNPVVKVISVANSLTLNAANPPDNIHISYVEVVIDLAVGATVTAGTNLTIVDTLAEGKRNVCIVRNDSKGAKLYKVLEIDLDDSSSN